MKCRAEFVFKSIEKRDGGEFKNDKGDTLKYDPSYILKCDEKSEQGINERKFKFPVTNKVLAEQLNCLEPYTKIELEFELTIYSSNCKITPIALIEE